MKYFLIKLTHCLLICFVLFLFFENAYANKFEGPGKSIVGLWQTTLTDKGADLIVTLDIHSTSNDSLACTFDVPDFGFLNIPMGKFKLEGDKFTLPGFNASYNVDNQTITGIFSSLGNENILEFNRIDSKPTFNFDYAEREIDWVMETKSPIWSPLTSFNNQLIFGNDAGNLYSINLEDLKTSWIFNSGSKIRSKALVKNNSVYFSSDDGYLYSIHFKDGKLNWKVYIGNDASTRSIPAKEASTYDYMCSSPVIEEETIYVGSIDSCLYAINYTNGEIKWKYKSGDMIRSTPIVDSGLVYFGSWDNHMYALDIKNGALVWKYDTGGNIQSSPVIVDNKVIFGSRSGIIFGLEKNSGTQLWKTSYWGSWVESSPVYYDGMIYIGSSDYRKAHAIDPENGQVIWKARVEGWAWSTPAISDKYIYIGSSGTMGYAGDMHGRFYAMNRLNGEIEWKVSIADNADVYVFGFIASPVVWKKWVFFADLEGKIYGIKE